MKKTIAFYDPYTTGHHVEYLFHIARAKILKNIKDSFILLVSKDFDEKISELIPLKDLRENEIEIQHIEEITGVPDFKFEQSLKNYKLQLSSLNQFVRKKKITHCVFMYLDNPMQIALSSAEGQKLNCQISGIVFNPFGGYGNRITKYYFSARKILQNYIMLTNRKIAGVYIIISQKTANRLNQIHFSKKFKFVSDPILKTQFLLSNLNEGKIDQKNRISFLLFGSLNKRKGIYTTLDALEKLEPGELKKIRVVFAGKLDPAEQLNFISQLEKIKKTDPESIELFNHYLQYKDIPRFLQACDFVLLPYNASQASSGVLGHAANYQKPVIGQGGGVFGKQVKKFRLGKTIKELNAQSLASVFKDIIVDKESIPFSKIDSEKYLNSRSDDFFTTAIFKDLGLYEKH